MTIKKIIVLYQNPNFGMISLWLYKTHVEDSTIVFSTIIHLNCHLFFLFLIFSSFYFFYSENTIVMYYQNMMHVFMKYGAYEMCPCKNINYYFNIF